MRLPILILLALDPASAAVAPGTAALSAIVGPAGGRVGFATLDLQSGRAIDWQADERFPTQSVFKLPIAIEVLLRADAGRLDLERGVTLGAADARPGPQGTMAVPTEHTIGELLEAMVTHSDNVACDKLLALIGGPAVVDARMRQLGVEGITIRFSEREMVGGAVDNTATPHALVNLLAKVARRQVGLSPAGAARLEDLLGRVATGQKRLKGELPPGTPVAHKTRYRGDPRGRHGRHQRRRSHHPARRPPVRDRRLRARVSRSRGDPRTNDRAAGALGLRRLSPGRRYPRRRQRAARLATG